ncbi:MAG: hypothetical protein ACI85K_002502 [Hyphomicrobiaceae bacterium]|jgi:hypothetical protein
MDRHLWRAGCAWLLVMKRFPLLVVAALFGLAVSAPAQARNGSGQTRASASARQQSQRGQATRPATRSARTSQNVRSGQRTQNARSVQRTANSRSVQRAQSARSVQRSQAARTSQRRVTSTRASRSAQVGHVSRNGLGRVARNVGRIFNSTSVRVGLGGGHRGYSHGHGRYVTRCEQVLVPGYFDLQYHAASHGWVYDSCGHRNWGVIEPAHHDRVWVPARYETQSRQVWVRY